MAKKAINHDKIMRESLQQRTSRARQAVRDERDALRKRVDEIRLSCGDAPRLLMDRLRERFLEVGRRLEANLDPDAQLFDERFTKRAANTAKAGCRLRQREARVEAEPGIRAGKIAHRGHLDTQKEAQKARKIERERTRAITGKIPKGEKRKEAEDAVVHELLADPVTAQLVPIWKRERAAMFRRAAAAEGDMSPYEAFLQWVEENFNEVQAELEKRAAKSDKQLAREQAAHAKKKAREAGADVPSEAFRVPSQRAPASGPRLSKRGAEMAPHTTRSGRTIHAA